MDKQTLFENIYRIGLFLVNCVTCYFIFMMANNLGKLASAMCNLSETVNRFILILKGSIFF